MSNVKGPVWTEAKGVDGFGTEEGGRLEKGFTAPEGVLQVRWAMAL